MTKPNTTEIVFVVDRSGSMHTIAADMVGGFAAFIEKQKEVPGECRVSLVRFDHEFENVFTALPLASVPPLALEPRGNTALLDAVGRTIVDTGERLKSMRESERPSSVLFVIVTDGHENASREYNRKRVFDMIKHQRDKYNWEFIFLGANQDSIAAAQDIGISVTNAVTFNATKGGTEGLMRGLSASVIRYRSAGGGKMDRVYDQAMYDAELKNQQLVVDSKNDPVSKSK